MFRETQKIYVVTAKATLPNDAASSHKIIFSQLQVLIKMLHDKFPLHNNGVLARFNKNTPEVAEIVLWNGMQSDNTADTDTTDERIIDFLSLHCTTFNEEPHQNEGVIYWSNSIVTIDTAKLPSIIADLSIFTTDTAQSTSIKKKNNA